MTLRLRLTDPRCRGAMSDTIGVKSFVLSHTTDAYSFKLILVDGDPHALATGQIEELQRSLTVDKPARGRCNDRTVRSSPKVSPVHFHE